MNADRLLAHYDRVAEARDAVPRLRRFVLDLAVRGKLVEQDPVDESATELLNRIEAEKARLVEAREIRRPKALVLLDREIFPFPLPKTWAWTQIAELGVLGPRNDYPDNNLASFVPMRMIPAKYGASHSCETRPWGEIKQRYTHFAEGDVGLAKITPCFENGKSVVFRNLTGDIGSGTTELHVVRPIYVDANYVLLFLKSPLFIDTGIKMMTGTAGQKRVPRGYFANSPFPLPPLAEQYRIVAKVDELMTLCDRLEKAHTARDDTRDRLTKACAARLSASNVRDVSYRSYARLAIDSLAELTASVNQVKQLRKTILSLAVRGMLVKQDQGDLPASQLLNMVHKIRTEQLEADYPSPSEARTQLKKQSNQELPVDLPPLPSGWSWATLHQCSLLTVDCKNKTAPYAHSGVKLVRTTNIRDGKLNAIDQKYVDERTYGLWSIRCIPEPGDLLITREAPMGEVCLIPSGEKICLGQRIMLIRLVPNSIDPVFLLYSLRDPNLMDRVQDKPLGMTVQHLRVGGVETLLVPLPPVAEQHRIVAKLDELMKLCKSLETILDNADNTRHRLLRTMCTASALVE